MIDFNDFLKQLSAQNTKQQMGPSSNISGAIGDFFNKAYVPESTPVSPVGMSDTFSGAMSGTGFPTAMAGPSDALQRPAQKPPTPAYQMGMQQLQSMLGGSNGGITNPADAIGARRQNEEATRQNLVNSSGPGRMVQGIVDQQMQSQWGKGQDGAGGGKGGAAKSLGSIGDILKLFGG